MTNQSTQSALTQWLHRQWLTHGWFSLVMRPFSWIVSLILYVRHAYFRALPSKIYRAPVPVLVIGNIYVGGTGKTPVLISLVKSLIQKGWHPGVISRGYGVKIGTMPCTGQGMLDPRVVGDEPALIALQTQVPVAVHPNRKMAIQSLLAMNPDIDLIVSDDGLQHLALARDVEIIVQDQRGTGNARIMPAGPLRESVARLNNVQAIITNVQDLSIPALDKSQQGGVRQTEMKLTITCLRRVIDDKKLTLQEFNQQTSMMLLAAAAGIGSPERFFNSLKKSGLSLHETLALPDHYEFNENTFKKIQSPLILITAKDAIKCTKLNDPRLWVVEVGAEYSDQAFFDWLSQTLHACATPPK